MIAYKEAVARFCAVRDSIDQREHPIAYRRAFGIRLLFYRDHTIEEARALLIASETDPAIEEVAQYMK